MVILYTLIIFIFSAASVFASSVYLNVVPEKVKKGEEFSITASFSASANKDYYLKIRLGSSSSSLSKGVTKNASNPSADVWLTDNDAWNKFPKIATDPSGFWQGSLNVKTLDSAFIGPSLAVLRIHSVDSSTNLDSDGKPFILEEGTQAPTEITKSVTLSEFPQKADVSAPFQVKGSVKYLPRATLALKSLIGTTDQTKDMIAGKTQGKSGEWLAWNAAWDKFSEVTTDEAGNATFSLTVKSVDDLKKGTYYLVVRAHDTSKEENFESTAVRLEFEEVVVRADAAQSSSVPSPASSPVNTVSSSPESSQVTVSPSPTPGSKPSKSTEPTPKSPKQTAEKPKVSPTTKTSSKPKNTKAAVVLEDLGIGSLSAVLGVSDAAYDQSEETTASARVLSSNLTPNSFIVIGLGLIIVVIGLFSMIKDSVPKDFSTKFGWVKKLMKR